MKLTPSLAHALIDLDHETGLMVWKPRPAQMFKGGRHSREHNCEVWNARFAGKPAFRYVGAQGYRRGRLMGRELKACWIVWFLVHGEWPQRLDHVNGIKGDDRPSNLRNVTQQENSKNCKRSKANASGATGVSPMPGGKFRATIGLDGKQVHLGSFTSFDDAVQARKRAEGEFGYHRNHGRTP